MTKAEILHGNRIIALFEGYTINENNVVTTAPIKDVFDSYDPLVGYPVSNSRYDISFDALIPVCRKWDNIPCISLPDEHQKKYVELSDDLDYAASLYELKPLFNQLVINLEWLSTIKLKNEIVK